MSNFSSLARLEVPEKFVWWVVGGGVCKVIFMSNPTVVLRLGLGWGFDKKGQNVSCRELGDEKGRVDSPAKVYSRHFSH